MNEQSWNTIGSSAAVGRLGAACLLSLLLSPACSRADCKTSEVVAGRVALAALDLAGTSYAIRQLADCDGRALTALRIDYDDGKCRGGVDSLEGGLSWRPEGPPWRSFPIGKAGPDALSISIRVLRPQPWPQYQVTLASPRCLRTLGLRVDHQMGRFVAEWLEDDANRPPEQWQCRADADCPTGKVCELPWREWSAARNAWRGKAGRCEPGPRCDAHGQCPDGLLCDPARIYSSATGTMVQPRCRSPIIESPARLESEADIMEAVRAMKWARREDLGLLCRRIADCPEGVDAPCAPCKAARFPCVSKNITNGCLVMLSCGEQLSLSPLGADTLNVDCL